MAGSPCPTVVANRSISNNQPFTSGLSRRRSRVRAPSAPPNYAVWRLSCFWSAAPQPAMLGSMTLRRMDNVGIVVDDLAAAIAFFVELGMDLEGEAPVEGRWVDRVVGLDGVRVDIAMMRTPDGHGRLELTKFHTPAAVSAEPAN